jgi:protein-S-isoprenylcysteine O-methyltransferase Ste14
VRAGDCAGRKLNVFANWALLTLGTLFGFRVGLEGRMMAERFGDAYRDYAAHTFRIVPGIF